MDGNPWPVIRVNDRVPYFKLESTQGRPVSPWDYRGHKNLVLFFFHGQECEQCRVLLEQFAQQYREYEYMDAEILGISRASLPELKELAKEINLPFPLLSDVDGGVASKFVGEDKDTYAAVFVTDRFGALYTQSAATDEKTLPSQQDILDWLLFIEIQCPECGAPEWAA